MYSQLHCIHVNHAKERDQFETRHYFIEDYRVYCVYVYACAYVCTRVRISPEICTISQFSRQKNSQTFLLNTAGTQSFTLLWLVLSQPQKLADTRPSVEMNVFLLRPALFTRLSRSSFLIFITSATRYNRANLFRNEVP